MEFNKKTILKLAVFIPLDVILIALILTQVIFTIKTSPMNVDCMIWDEMESIEVTIESFRAGTLDDYEHAWSFNGELPSDDPNDYADIYCRFKVKNTGYIDQYKIDATLKSAEKYSENILFVIDAGAASTPRVWRRDTTQACVILKVYIGNLDENQIQELVNGLTLSVKAHGDYLGTRHRTVSYKKCDDITIDNSRNLL